MAQIVKLGPYDLVMIESAVRALCVEAIETHRARPNDTSKRVFRNRMKLYRKARKMNNEALYVDVTKGTA